MGLPVLSLVSYLRDIEVSVRTPSPFRRVIKQAEITYTSATMYYDNRRYQGLGAVNMSRDSSRTKLATRLSHSNGPDSSNHCISHMRTVVASIICGLLSSSLVTREVEGLECSAHALRHRCRCYSHASPCVVQCMGCYIFRHLDRHVSFGKSGIQDLKK